jgi:hypothetical protein
VAVALTGLVKGALEPVSVEATEKGAQLVGLRVKPGRSM